LAGIEGNLMHSIGRFLMAGAIGAAICISGTNAFSKTAKECNADYAANRPAIQAAKQTKAAFIKACLAGKETMPMTPPAVSAPPTPLSGY
jgi:hypothetical protein